MKSYRDFCTHYDLTPSPEARQQYRNYIGNAELLRSAVLRQGLGQQKTTPANRPKS